MKAAMQRLDTKSLFSVRCSSCLFLVFLWVLTIYGLVNGSSGVVVLFFTLPLLTFFIPRWLATFKQVTLNGRSLIVSKSGHEALIPVNIIKRVSQHPLGRGLSHVTIVFRATTPFGRTIRVKTCLSDCEQIATLIHQAMEARGA